MGARASAGPDAIPLLLGAVPVYTRDGGRDSAGFVARAFAQPDLREFPDMSYTGTSIPAAAGRRPLDLGSVLVAFPLATLVLASNVTREDDLADFLLICISLARSATGLL